MVYLYTFFLYRKRMIWYDEYYDSYAELNKFDSMRKK